MSVVKANEILKQRYEILKLPNNFKSILGNLPVNIQGTMLLHGIAGSRKSTYSLLFAKELLKFAHVIYGNFEESVGATLQAKLKLIKLNDNKRIYFIEPNTQEEFWKLLDTGLYKYAIVDSLSHIANKEKQVLLFGEKVKAHPKISFVFICHALKIGAPVLCCFTDTLAKL